MKKWLKKLFCKHDYIMYAFSANVEYFECKKCDKQKDVWVYTYKKKV